MVPDVSMLEVSFLTARTVSDKALAVGEEHVNDTGG